MKHQILRTIAILGLFIMLAMTSASAQTTGRVEVKIPFDFTAGKATVKAGTYKIRKISESYLSIRSLDGKTSVLVNAPLTIGSRDSKAGQRLVFNQYGDHYFLSQVWLSAEVGRQIFTSSAEEKAAREYKLAHKDGKPQRVEIATRQ